MGLLILGVGLVFAAYFFGAAIAAFAAADAEATFVAGMMEGFDSFGWASLTGAAGFLGGVPMINQCPALVVNAS